MRIRYISVFLITIVFLVTLFSIYIDLANLPFVFGFVPPSSPSPKVASGSSSQSTIPSVVEVICIEDQPYGQTFNMILTIAAARTMAYEFTNHIRHITTNSSSSSPTSTSTATTTSIASTPIVIVKVGLGPSFSDLFHATLEPQNDILLYYYNHTAGATSNISRENVDEATNTNDPQPPICHYHYTAEHLFRNFLKTDWYVNNRIPILQSLIPKHTIRQQARSYLQNYLPPNTNDNTTAPTIITVHRRNFEGRCRKFQQSRHSVLCLDPQTGNLQNSTNFLSDKDLINLCQLHYSMIQSDWQQDNHNYLVLLCSDRQVPKYDNTFPHLVSITPEIPNHNYIQNTKLGKAIVMVTEAWIMTLSNIHYGHPMSTVDVVVNVWRNSPHIHKYLLVQSNDENESTIFTNGTTPLLYHPPREMRPVACYGSHEN